MTHLCVQTRQKWTIVQIRQKASHLHNTLTVSLWDTVSQSSVVSPKAVLKGRLPFALLYLLALVSGAMLAWLGRGGGLLGFELHEVFVGFRHCDSPSRLVIKGTAGLAA